MLFNSYIFIFIFLPIALLGFHLLGKFGNTMASMIWLIIVSLFFYGWWNPAYLFLISASIIFNYSIGSLLGGKPSKLLLYLGVIVNLGLIGYFKYSNFFIDNISTITDTNINFEQVILPLAISFFTFQQIAYLIDSYRGLTCRYGFFHYCLFVTFFPQLIAGPIVHHKEILPQFSNELLRGINSSNLAVGITIFILGLFKKVVFADNAAEYATPVFEAAENGVALTLFEAWGGGLAYTLQIYFDFSGYSDMAIGLARMFGVILPINFYSPYKAGSIIDFWHRWHITLSRFLRDYVYFSLGGNRKGKARRYVNLIVTMLIGGIWHGAGWTFIVWGGLHGFYLSINHGWRALVIRFFGKELSEKSIYKFFARFITFVAVVIAWVMFRAESLAGAGNMYAAMFGRNGISLPSSLEAKLPFLNGFVDQLGVSYNGMFNNGVFGGVLEGVLVLFIMLLIVWFIPNSLFWTRKDNPVLDMEYKSVDSKFNFLNWSYNSIFAFILALASLVCILNMASPSEFLYFQF